MAFDFGDFIRLAKKAFKVRLQFLSPIIYRPSSYPYPFSIPEESDPLIILFVPQWYQKNKAQNQQQQSGGNGGQGGGGNGPYPQQQQYQTQPQYNNNHNNNNNNNYQNNNHQNNQHQNNNSQQPHHQQQYQNQATVVHPGGMIGGGGGYGSHDGPATNQDMANAQDPHYVQLRNQAITEGDLMAKAFSDSQAAYNSGDGGRAKNLSIEGKDHQRRKDDFNMQAASWIFAENNKRQPAGTVDLHGLYVQESVAMTERAVEASRGSGATELRVIVGKGNHSQSHVAKIAPAIEELMVRQNLTAYLDPNNSGVLVVQLNGQGGKGSREVVQDLERQGGTGCLVM